MTELLVTKGVARVCTGFLDLSLSSLFHLFEQCFFVLRLRHHLRQIRPGMGQAFATW